VYSRLREGGSLSTTAVSGGALATNRDPDYILHLRLSVWFEDNSVRLATDDRRFVADDGQTSGLQIVFSADPRSADYHPLNYNAMVRWGKEFKIHVPELVQPEPAQRTTFATTHLEAAQHWSGS
jgi:hypothetical protein